MEPIELPCVVCSTPVSSAPDADPNFVLCPLHFFSEDLSEEWERGDGTQEEPE
jgi:hypothetical protein